MDFEGLNYLKHPKPFLEYRFLDHQFQIPNTPSWTAPPQKKQAKQNIQNIFSNAGLVSKNFPTYP